MSKTICLLTVPQYKAGDPPPEGYLQWHEWARVQNYHRIRQKQCRDCDLWVFPNEKCGCGVVGGNPRMESAV